MSHARPARRLLAFSALLTLLGCEALGPAATLGPGPLRGPTSDDPSPELVVDGPPVQTLPVARPAAPSSSPSPAPTPSPSPTPTQLVFDAFLIKALPTWRVDQAQAVPPAMILRASDGTGALRVWGEPSSLTLEAMQTTAQQAAGPGLVTVQTIMLDELRGYLVGANRDTPDGRRWVVERGFRYRDRHWRIVSEWDKAAPGVDRVITDVETMLRTFRWM